MTSFTKISAHTEVATLYFHHPSSENYVNLTDTRLKSIIFSDIWFSFVLL